MSLHENIEAEILSAVVKGLYKDSEVLSQIDPGFFAVESYKWLVKFLKKRSWKSVEWEYLDVQLSMAFTEDIEKLEVYRTQLYQLYQREITYLDDADNDFKEFVACSIVKASVKSSFDAYERSKRFDYFITETRMGTIIASFVYKEHLVKFLKTLL